MWGGIALGAAAGLIITSVSFFIGKGFHWTTVGKGIVVGILFGLGAELLGKIPDRMKYDHFKEMKR